MKKSFCVLCSVYIRCLLNYRGGSLRLACDLAFVSETVLPSLKQPFRRCIIKRSSIRSSSFASLSWAQRRPSTAKNGMQTSQELPCWICEEQGAALLRGGAFPSAFVKWRWNVEWRNFLYSRLKFGCCSAAQNGSLRSRIVSLWRHAQTSISQCQSQVLFQYYIEYSHYELILIVFERYAWRHFDSHIMCIQ